MGKSIFDIDRELLDIFEELEENGGELTPEIEEKLQLNSQEITRKVKSYVAYINKLKADEAAIKSEQDRLTALKKSKDNTIKSITNLVLYAIHNFGDEDKKGKKFFDWGTGKVSIRNSTAVEVDTNKIEHVTETIKDVFANGIFTNTLQCNDSVDIDSLIDSIQQTAVAENNAAAGEVEVEDLDDITVNVTIPISAAKLLNGEGYNLMKQIGYTNPNGWDFKPTVDKKSLKTKIVEEGCTSNIGKVVTNENLNIK
jgi:hypothetical protein